jgi:cyclophilin family peptidyl-prolyl cis-trans isomerase
VITKSSRSFVSVPFLLVLSFGLVACGSSDSVEVVTETAVANAPTETIPETIAAAGDVAPALGSVAAFGTGPCAAADGSAPQKRQFDAAPQKCIDQAKSYVATMKTNKGTMVFTLLDDKSPVTVNSFVNLARSKYYDGIFFHRIVPQFVLQAGDPGALAATDVGSAGAGGPGYDFADELPQQGEYKIGSLAMANAGPNTNGSQFFIISGPNGTTLPPNYALFGQLTDAPENLVTMEAIAALGVGDGPPSEPVSIESVTISES